MAALAMATRRAVQSSSCIVASFGFGIAWSLRLNAGLDQPTTRAERKLGLFRTVSPPSVSGAGLCECNSLMRLNLLVQVDKETGRRRVTQRLALIPVETLRSRPSRLVRHSRRWTALHGLGLLNLWGRYSSS